jgi:hypothetical protein
VGGDGETDSAFSLPDYPRFRYGAPIWIQCKMLVPTFNYDWFFIGICPLGRAAARVWWPVYGGVVLAGFCVSGTIVAPDNFKRVKVGQWGWSAFLERVRFSFAMVHVQWCDCHRLGFDDRLVCSVRTRGEALALASSRHGRDELFCWGVLCAVFADWYFW